MQYAWDKSIVIVTPSTLMATLKTISSIWSIQKQEANALKIAEVGGRMYDKFEGFVRDIIDIGKNIDKTKDSYESAYNKLASGRGNLVLQAENMRRLGAKAKKSLSNQVVEDAGSMSGNVD